MEIRTKEVMEVMNGGPLPAAAERLHDQAVAFSEKIGGPSGLTIPLLALILALVRDETPMEPRPSPALDQLPSLTKEDIGRQFRRNGSIGTFTGRGPRGFYNVNIDDETLLLNPQIFHTECELIDG